VIPTLLSWRHSVVVNDIKGENWAVTAGFRKALGHTVLKFDPTSTDGSSVRYNPLEEIRLRSDFEIMDVQNIATMIVDPDGKGMADHWAKTGYALLVGAILHVLYSEKDRTLRGVASFLSCPSRDVEQTMNLMLSTPHLGSSPHPVIAESARELINKSENERSGVISTAMSFLSLYRDPVIANVTAVSDFRISDLMNHETPVSLFLIMPPSDKDRLKPLIRLILNQIVRQLTEKMEFYDGRALANYKHRLLLLIDEFPALGRLDVMQEALAFIAGYGIKAFLITQDLSQLYAAYGKDEAIISNCHIRLAFAPNKIETAELLSKMTGTSTVTLQQESFSGKRFDFMLGNTSHSMHYFGRSLLTPDEVMRLPKDVALVFVAGNAPILGKKIRYFEDRVFSARSQLPCPLVSDRIRSANIVVQTKNSSLPNNSHGSPVELKKNHPSTNDHGPEISVMEHESSDKEDINEEELAFEEEMRQEFYQEKNRRFGNPR
jgi:type IV secretion system protein VirD4